jgi:hypothetical protein
MDSTFFRVALGIFLLLVFASIIVAVLFGVYWLIVKGVELLLAIPKVEKFMFKVRQKAELWFEQRKVWLGDTWDALWEIMLIPTLNLITCYR